VPYEDILIHPDDYYNTASYGEDFIQDPYQAPFVTVMKLAVALTDNEFYFYDPEEIKTRCRTLSPSQIRDNSTLGTDIVNSVLVDSDDDDSGQQGNDTDDSEGDFIQPQKIIKTADRDEVEEIEDGSETADSKVELDELEDDVTQNGKGNTKFEVCEDMDVDVHKEGEKRKNLSAKSENGEAHVICYIPFYMLTAIPKGQLMISQHHSWSIAQGGTHPGHYHWSVTRGTHPGHYHYHYHWNTTRGGHPGKQHRDTTQGEAYPSRRHWSTTGHARAIRG
jgi:hypothetical protein